MEWPQIRELMLQEPKPAISCVVQERADRTRSARVLHDGVSRWLIWSDEKLEFNDGSRSVILSQRGARAHDSDNVHSHGWLKYLFHPHLTNIGLDEVTGRVIGSSSVCDIPCWSVEVDGLREDEDVAFTLEVHRESGIIMAVSRRDERHIEVREVAAARLPDAVFSWQGAVDSDESSRDQL